MNTQSASAIIKNIYGTDFLIELPENRGIRTSEASLPASPFAHDIWTLVLTIKHT